jgi:hypothetical protein
MPPRRWRCFRYRLIAEAANPRLGPAERGQLVRELASQPVELPDGRLHHFARGTFDRWLRAYREQGLAGLKPEPRAYLGLARRHPELLEEACQLRIELPARSAAQISAILLARHGVRVAERTVREHLQHRGLQRAALAQHPHVFGRFEASKAERALGRRRVDRSVRALSADELVASSVPFPARG